MKRILPKPTTTTTTNTSTTIKIRLPNSASTLYNPKSTKIQPRVNITTPHQKITLQTSTLSPCILEIPQIKHSAKNIIPATSTNSQQNHVTNKISIANIHPPQPFQIFPAIKILSSGSNQTSYSIVVPNIQNTSSGTPEQQLMQILTSENSLNQQPTILLIDSSNTNIRTNGLPQVLQNSLQFSNNATIVRQCSDPVVNNSVSTNGQSNVTIVQPNNAPSPQIVRIANQ